MAKTREMYRSEKMEERIRQLNEENEQLKNYSEALRAECVSLRAELDKYVSSSIPVSEYSKLKECIVRMALDRYGMR